LPRPEAEALYKSITNSPVQGEDGV
jgi:hypothetical protein